MRGIGTFSACLRQHCIEVAFVFRLSVMLLALPTLQAKPHAQNKQQGTKRAAPNPFKSAASPSIDRFFQKK